MNTERAVQVCICLCLCAHGCVYVYRPAAMLLVRLSEGFASVCLLGLLSWPPGSSVTTDTRAKFTSVKVINMKRVLDKVSGVTSSALCLTWRSYLSP